MVSETCPKCGCVMLPIKPVHGNCCTCPRCGMGYDDCVCHEVDGELCLRRQNADLRKQVEAATENEQAAYLRGYDKCKRLLEEAEANLTTAYLKGNGDGEEAKTRRAEIAEEALEHAIAHHFGYARAEAETNIAAELYWIVADNWCDSCPDEVKDCDLCAAAQAYVLAEDDYDEKKGDGTDDHTNTTD